MRRAAYVQDHVIRHETRRKQLIFSVFFVVQGAPLPAGFLDRPPPRRAETVLAISLLRMQVGSHIGSQLTCRCVWRAADWCSLLFIIRHYSSYFVRLVFWFAFLFSVCYVRYSLFRWLRAIGAFATGSPSLCLGATFFFLLVENHV